MAMDVEAEIRDLKRRASEFGFLTEQVKGVHKDLLRFEEKTDAKLREHDTQFDRLDAKISAVECKINSKVDGLAKALPIIMSDGVPRSNARAKRQAVIPTRLECIHESKHVKKLNAVRLALYRSDVAEAAKYGRVFELTPAAAK